jgi:hypothetical protein
MPTTSHWGRAEGSVINISSVVSSNPGAGMYMGAVAVFLASDDTHWIAGESLRVASGLR